MKEIVNQFYDAMIDVEEAEMKVNNLLTVIKMMQENYDCKDERKRLLAVLDVIYSQTKMVQQELNKAITTVNNIDRV